jgi:molybdopterin biosynthesis enzyme
MAFNRARGARIVVLHPAHPQRITTLTPLADALDRWFATFEPVRAGREDVLAAIGATLAEDLVATSPLPERAEAAIDGRAVRADQVHGASEANPVYLTQAPARVDAGGALPAGSDAILPEDAVAGCAAWVEVGASAAPGQGLRAAGYDADPGTVLGQAGERVTPVMAVVARLAGSAAAMARRPRVTLVITGDPGIIDAVGPLLADSLSTLGATVVGSLRVPADRKAIGRALRSPGSDFVVTVGGTGVGTNDHTVAALSEVGRLVAHGLALSPGETAALGLLDRTPVLMLPGRLDAALAAWLLAGRPALQRLAGSAPPSPDPLLPLTRKLVSAIGITELQFARRENQALTPLGSAGLPLSRLARADRFIVVPPHSEGWQAGTQVSSERLPVGHS